MYYTCVERSVCVITALYLFTLRCNQRTSHLEFFDSMQFSSCKSQLFLDGAPVSAGEFSV